MDLKRLFRVLVVGGAVVGGCGDSMRTAPITAEDAGEDGESPADADEREAPAEGERDAVAVDVDVEMSDAGARDATSGEPAPKMLCFCAPRGTCCTEPDGVPTLAEGFECCWGTTC